MNQLYVNECRSATVSAEYIIDLRQLRMCHNDWDEVSWAEGDDTELGEAIGVLVAEVVNEHEHGIRKKMPSWLKRSGPWAVDEGSEEHVYYPGEGNWGEYEGGAS
jgi:hypothetical protein